MERNKIFIVYEGVIKTPHIFILKMLYNEVFRDRLNDVIDFNKFDYLDDNNLMRFVIQRTNKDIMKYISKEGVDLSDVYNTIHSSFNDMYIDSPILNMAENIYKMMTTNAISDFYFYTEKYDERVATDLAMMYPGCLSKVHYVYGDLKEVICNTAGISLYIVDDIEFINTLRECAMLYMKEILIGNYGYNYKLGNENDTLQYKYNFIEDQKKETFKYAFYNVFNMDESFFTQVPE